MCLGILQTNEQMQKQHPAWSPKCYSCAWVMPITSHHSLGKIFTNHKSDRLGIKGGPCAIWQCNLQLFSRNVPTSIPINSGTNKKSTIRTITSIEIFSFCHFIANTCNMKIWKKLAFYFDWNIIKILGARCVATEVCGTYYFLAEILS